TILEVLDGYMKNLKKNEHPNTYKIDQFLRNFTKVFSLNYDTLSYRIFSNFFGNPGDQRFSDGFRGKEPLTTDQIKDNIKLEKKRFYFPHGAFHIMCKGSTNGPYHKISIHRHNFYTTLKGSIKNIIKMLINSDPASNDTNEIERPLLIFEDRPDVKKAIIMKDAYLSRCYKTLKEKVTGHVFVFGCSFERDTHILEALLLGTKKDLYIAYWHEDEKIKKTVENFLEKHAADIRNKEKLAYNWSHFDYTRKNIKWVKIEANESIWHGIP
ncbi:MAG: DUF4917 family protein, partial [Candidatus Nucleicultricaceae bacterium]